MSDRSTTDRPEPELLIRRAGPDDVDRVMEAGHLFDEEPTRPLAADALGRPGHHLLIGYFDDKPVGFVSGVEIAHPDKRVEMLVYELGVDESHRRRGVASRLLTELDRSAAEAGCRGLWVLTEPDNQAALATYGARAAERDDDVVLFEWESSG